MKVKTEETLKLLKRKSSNSGSHEGSGLTTEEIGEKLGIGREAALTRVKLLVKEGKLKVVCVSGINLSGRRCQFVTYEATGKESKK